MSKLTTSLISLLAATTFSSCATVKTEPFSDSNTSTSLTKGGGAEGVVYALPRRDLRVTIERKLVKKEDASKAVTAAKAAVKSSQEGLTVAKSRQQSAVAFVISLRQDSLEEAKEAAKTEHEASLAAVEKAKIALLAAKKNLSSAQSLAANPFSGDCPRVVYSVGVSELPMSPDPDLRFTANLLHTPFRDDTLNIKLNEAGLLSSTESETTDRTATIITDIARTFLLPQTAAGSVIKNNTFHIEIDPTDANDDGATECVTPKPFKAEYVFDPEKVMSQKTLSDSDAMNVPDLEFALKVDKYSSDYQSDVDATVFEQKNWLGRKKKVGGLLYRQPVAYRISIVSDEDENKYVAYDNIHVIPNGGPIGIAPMRAGLFTTSNTSLTFKDGMLVAYSAKRPSEVAQVVRIPLDVFDGLVDSVSKLIPFTDSNATQAKTYAEAQAILLEATDTYGQDAENSPAD